MFGLKIQLNAWQNYRFLYNKTDKEYYTSFCRYRFLRALQQNRAQSRLLYLLNTDDDAGMRKLRNRRV